MCPANRQGIRQSLSDTLLCSLSPGEFRGTQKILIQNPGIVMILANTYSLLMIQSSLFSVYKLIFSLISIQLTRILIFANKLELFANIML